jgi:hypothetical protein
LSTRASWEPRGQLRWVEDRANAEPAPAGKSAKTVLTIILNLTPFFDQMWLSKRDTE